MISLLTFSLSFLFCELCFKLARQQVEKGSVKDIPQEMPVVHHSTVTVSPPVTEAHTSTTTAQVASSPASVAPVVATSDVQTAIVSRSSASPMVSSPVKENADGVQIPVVTPCSDASENAEAAVTVNNAAAELMYRHLTAFKCFRFPSIWSRLLSFPLLIL